MNKAMFHKFSSLLLVASIISINFLNAQTPTNCLEIESILVDACGTPEGENEMVRFKIGPASINISNLSVNWPNNTFLGISPVNATTTNNVNALNSTITSCGYLVQPVSGVLPAGKTILLISSTNISLAANSFSNLTDTLYVIFQNAGNTSGHFANYNATPGLRTLVISTISPACSDAVMYDRSLLRNQSGGFGGTSAQNDGATVQFTWPGADSYINNGCQAPIEVITSDAGNDTIVCPSGTVNLNGIATGNYTGVIWMGGQGSFSSPTNLNTSYTASPSETGSINLSLGAIGPCNDTIFSSVTLTISSLPSAAITPSGSTIFCQGNNVMLTASGGSTYTWSTGSSASSITVSAGGTYTVTAINSCGSQTATQTITVNPLPTVNISASGSTTICSGDSITLYASGNGSFSWSTGSTVDSIIVSAGTYTLTSTNSCGSQTDTQTIAINPLPTAVISTSGSTIICTGDSVSLIASGGSTYSWSTGATGNSITVSATGTYTVTSSNSCGSQTATQVVTVDPLPTASISASGSTIFCSGDSVTLYASGIGSYSWNTGSIADSVTISAAGTYTLISSNSCGSQTATQTIIINPLPTASILASGSTTICAGDSVILIASGGSTYTWSTGAAGDSIVVSAAGSYTVTSSNSCGSQTATQLVTLATMPSVTINSAATFICPGNSLLLYASGTGSFLWSNGASNDSIVISTGGTYIVNSSGSCGNASDSLTINLLPLPNASISASGATALCPGDSITLNGSGGSTYSWLPSGTSGSSFIISTPGTYTLSAINSCGSDTTTITLTAQNNPNAIITPAGNLSVCPGDNLTLNATGGLNYLWSNGETGSSISASTEGTYWLIAGNNCGSDSTSVYVNIDSVEALFIADTLSGLAPLEVQFTNNSSFSATGFLWNFGDNSTSTDVSPIHIYQESGTYVVTLTAINASGCTESISATIVVFGSPSFLQVPNVFTPNGDGQNDNFQAIGSGITEFNCKIYDRWGILMHEITDFKGSWDGRTSVGLRSSDGTYFYLVKAKGADGIEYQQEGFVQLINQ